MKEPSAPCKDCKDRKLHCHDKCEKYLTFKKDHAAYVKFIRQQKQSDYDLDDVEKKRFEKYNKAKIRHDKEGAYK